jgi:hypothetical protein
MQQQLQQQTSIVVGHAQKMTLTQGWGGGECENNMVMIGRAFEGAAAA